MKSSRTVPSWRRVACATVAASILLYLLGMAAAFVWEHLFAAFGALMLLALVTIKFHPRSRRVAGVPVKQEHVTAS